MERCPRLKIICKHGAGLDNIHLEKAKELGIAVCNVPGTNSNAVADLTFGLMLAVAGISSAPTAGSTRAAGRPPLAWMCAGRPWA